MKTKTKYTFIPLPGLAHEPSLRRTLDSSEQWKIHLHPYQTLPPLECHIAPPFAIINAGPKCAGADLDAIARACCQTNGNQQALKDRLELLCRSEEHTSELQSHLNLVCRLLLEKKKKKIKYFHFFKLKILNNNYY